MSNWTEYLDEENRVHRKAKINKNVFCKKNKIAGSKYGYHVYENGNKFCKLCGHKNKIDDKAVFEKEDFKEEKGEKNG